MNQIRFLLGLCPTHPAGGTYNAPPDLLVVLKGPTSKGREGKGEVRKTGYGRRRDGKNAPKWGAWICQCSRRGKWTRVRRAARVGGPDIFFATLSTNCNDASNQIDKTNNPNNKLNVSNKASTY